MDATDLMFAGADRQAQLVATGEIGARELVQASLDRIAAVDPQLNAFSVVLAEEALAAADALDTGEPRPLLGVPIAIKEDADVAGLPTTFGTAANDGPKERDGEMVRRLRAAGAIVVGKTRVPELMMWNFTETLTYGVTRNPWDLQRTPGGSSGGTGAAVAAGLVGVGQGSDGAGSIRIPAAWCGLFGLKPTRDVVPLDPYDGAWQGLSVYGPLGRHVADARRFMEAVVPGFSVPELPERLRVAVSLKPPPGAVARISDDSRRAVESTAELLRSLGHEVVEREPEQTLGAFNHVLVRYLVGIHDDAERLPHPERLERRTRGMARRGALLKRLAPRARAQERAVAAGFDAVLADCDAILQPGPVQPPFRIGALHGRGPTVTLQAAAFRVPFQGVWNAIGYPAAAIPAGVGTDGLPVGVQLGGRAGDDGKLLAIAAQLEQARPWADRRPAL